jgi:cell division protease FtsH
MSQEENQKSAKNQHNSAGAANAGPTKTQVKADIRKFKPTPKFWTPGLIASIILILLSLGSWAYKFNVDSKGATVPQSQIIDRIKKGEYDKVIEQTGLVILETQDGGKLTRYNATLPENTKTTFYDTVVPNVVPELKYYNYEQTTQIGFGDVFITVAFVAGLVMVFMVIRNMNSSGGKIFEFGQSKARLLFGKKTGISFKDVAGIDDAKEELIEVVDFLRNPKKYLEAGARIPKGVLLVGAPGTGKTLLAKAVAGEAGVPFFHTSGSEFEEMLVGAGASRVRDLFAKAKKATPCIIFIDEIDAVAKKRGTVLQAGNTEQTLNQLLVEMDGLEERDNVIVIGATNRADVLDPAILRPGRFDRTVVVSMPDYAGRKQIIEVHTKNKKFLPGADLDLVARKTVGFSGADIENLLNEAAIMAAKEGRKEIKKDDLMEAFLKVKIGRKKAKTMTEDDVKRTAYHEAGHAVVSKYVPESDPVEKISIVSRGMAGGVTVNIPQEDTSYMKKTQMLAKLRVLVAGKVAEEDFMGGVSTGPSSDLQHATHIAKDMLTRYGMNEKLGFVQYEDLDSMSYIGYNYGGQRDYSEETAKLIDSELRRLMDEAIADARKILNDHKDKVEVVVAMLLEKEVVDREEFEAMF